MNDAFQMLIEEIIDMYDDLEKENEVLKEENTRLQKCINSIYIIISNEEV